jgi:MFS family permease
VRHSIAAAFGTPALRRLQTAWLVSASGGWVFFVVLSVYAYEMGGTTAVGVAALVPALPAALAAPLAATLADRCSRRDVLLGSLVARAALLAGVTAAVAAGAPLALVLVLGALFTVVATAHKPAQAALLPTLASTPSQLAASNAVWSGIDNGAFLFGSVIAGAVIAGAGVATAFGVTAALFAVAALPVALIARDPVPEYRRSPDGDESAGAGVREGFVTVAREPSLRLVVGFLSVSTFVEGAIDVLVVVMAIELLDLGGSGVGWLNACWGLGGLLGGVAALVLLGQGRLARGLALGGLLAGLPLVVAAGIGAPVAIGALLVVLGVGYALVEVAGLSLMQRLSADDVLARAFGVVESSYWVTGGLGAILAPFVVMGLGIRGALVAVGAALPLLVVLRWRALRRLEDGAPVPERPFRALRAIPDFGPLPLAAVENLAQRAVALEFSAGEVVIHEGDVGELFYVVDEGVLSVSCNRGSDVLEPLGPGAYFGEIALLRDIPRTATVTAASPVVSLFAVDREAFLAAVMTHPTTDSYVNGAATRRYANAHARRTPRDAGGVHRTPTLLR